MSLRVNAILTEEAVRAMDEIRAVKQRLCTKPLTRPDIVRMALEEFIVKELAKEGKQ